MEKYRQFADGGTGVNPFVPAWSHHKSPLALRLGISIVMLPIVLLRLFLLAFALLWLACSEALCAVIPVGFIRYPLRCLLSPLGCRLALIALGIIPLGDALADHRRLKLAASKTGGAVVFRAPHGTVVLANQQGVTDVFILALKLCPTFAFVADDGSPVRLGLFGALRRSLGSPAASASTAAKPLAEISSAAKAGWGGPVVLFAEGANTNGGSVLAWQAKTFEGVETLEQPVGVALVGLEYSKAGAYTPHHTVGSGLRHVLWQCLQPWHTVRSQWLPPQEAAAAIRGKPLDQQWPMLRTLLVRMLPGAVEVDVPAQRHAEFKAYWDASQKKGYTKPSAQTAGKKRA